MVLRSTENFCFGEVLRSSAWPQFFLNKEVRVMLLVLFCDLLLSTHSLRTLSILLNKKILRPDQQTQVILSHYTGVSRDRIARLLPCRCESGRLSCTVGEVVHRPVKVYDQLGDAYKQVVNSHGVRRPVSRTLCACGFTTYVTCLKDAWGSTLNIYAKNCQAWAHHGLLAQARGGHPTL